MVMHINGPNIKFFIIIGTRVKGIQKTARRRSLIAKFNRNTLVTVLILLFCTNVKITRPFPITARMKIVLYIPIAIFVEVSSSSLWFTLLILFDVSFFIVLFSIN
jgi:uncharacterized radical SAM superfamily protein